MDDIASSLAYKENEVMELQETIESLKNETPTALAESMFSILEYKKGKVNCYNNIMIVLKESILDLKSLFSTAATPPPSRFSLTPTRSCHSTPCSTPTSTAHMVFICVM